MAGGPNQYAFAQQSGQHVNMAFSEVEQQFRISNAGTGAASSLWSGTGVPPNTLGISGDFYLRFDGGGAGSTHLYFNNAGSWLGVA